MNKNRSSVVSHSVFVSFCPEDLERVLNVGIERSKFADIMRSFVK